MSKWGDRMILFRVFVEVFNEVVKLGSRERHTHDESGVTFNRPRKCLSPIVAPEW